MEFKIIEKLSDEIFNLPLDWSDLGEFSWEAYLGYTKKQIHRNYFLFVYFKKNHFVAMNPFSEGPKILKSEKDFIGWFSLIQHQCQERNIRKSFKAKKDLTNLDITYRKEARLELTYSNEIFSLEPRWYPLEWDKKILRMQLEHLTWIEASL